ncbi:MAG: hypothetical protein Q9164_002056, partial [Protoblastenia rupestris]
MKPDRLEISAVWYHKAEVRKRAIDQYLWNEDKGMHSDYDTVKKAQTGYETATTFWAIWAGSATPRQVAALATKALLKFEVF